MLQWHRQGQLIILFHFLWLLHLLRLLLASDFAMSGGDPASMVDALTTIHRWRLSRLSASRRGGAIDAADIVAVLSVGTSVSH